MPLPVSYRNTRLQRTALWEMLNVEKHEQLFERFVDFENLYDGYRMARQDKRYKSEVLTYSANLEERLIDLQNSLIWQTYKVDGMHEFYEYYPKKRIITVMPFGCRVANCAAYNVLWPIYRKSMYEHSYGSIAGKGPIKACDTLQNWIRLVSRKPDKWVICKMDIAKFFFRIPFEVQMKHLTKPIRDDRMKWFLETAIKCDGRPFGLSLDSSNVEECERVFGIGMQVGSLISQVTGNVVMSSADHYIKRVLGAPYYLRYMDDMIFLAPSKEKAQDILFRFESYLYDNLGLQLNSKTAIMPLDAGVEFVGKRVWPDKITLRKSTTLHMKRHLRYVMEHYTTGEITLDYALSVIRSYLGLTQHCDCENFRNKMVEDFKLVRSFAEECPYYEYDPSYYEENPYD